MVRNVTPPENVQRWLPDRYAAHGRFVAVLAEPLIALLAPKPGERILDLGCGDGALTEKIAATGASVVGVDASADQIEAARARGLDARVADGQKLAFDSEFDAVLTNAALHWMKDADAVIDGIWRALKPGGRLIGEMGGEGNIARIAGALVTAMERRGLDGRAAFPWYFPGPGAYRGKLEARGFEVSCIELIPRPTPLPADIEGWFETFGEAFLLAVPESGRSAFVDEVREALRPQLQDESGTWIADYVRLRFAARKGAHADA